LEKNIAEVIAKNAILSKDDRFESFIDAEMQKIGVQFNQPFNEIEKLFNLKFKKYWDEEEKEERCYLCVDSGGFYIIFGASPKHYMKGLDYVGVQLYKPSKLVCDKQIVFNISETYLAKQSSVLLKKLEGIERANNYYINNKNFYTYSKYNKFPLEADNKRGLGRSIDFNYSESIPNVIDGYAMSLWFERN
jgi:hypothetical protein